MTIYAIGDVHGHLSLLERALDLIETDRAQHGASDAELIYIGDLVDRGPASAEVIERVRAQREEDSRVTVLRGNHDHMLLEFLQGAVTSVSPRGRFAYLSSGIGGRSTMQSYGIASRLSDCKMQEEAAQVIPQKHIDFLASLPFYHQSGECLFVHAGIRPRIPLGEQEELDLIWIRDEFLWDATDHGVLVVHGHTPGERAEHFGNRLNIDSGAAYGGPLSAVAIEGRDAYLLTPKGREQL